GEQLRPAVVQVVVGDDVVREALGLEPVHRVQVGRVVARRGGHPEAVLGPVGGDGAQVGGVVDAAVVQVAVVDGAGPLGVRLEDVVVGVFAALDVGEGFEVLHAFLEPLVGVGQVGHGGDHVGDRG